MLSPAFVLYRLAVYRVTSLTCHTQNKWVIDLGSGQIVRTKWRQNSFVKHVVVVVVVMVVVVVVVPEQNQHCRVLFSSGGDFDNVAICSGGGDGVVLVSLLSSSRVFLSALWWYKQSVLQH